MKPPYITIGWLEAFFNLAKRVKIEVVDRHFIAQYDVAPLGNASKVVSALKFLNIIDSKGKAIEENLTQIKLEGEREKEGFRKIIEKSYEQLLNKIDVSKAKIEDLNNYFISTYKYSSLQAKGSVKFFLYLAKKAKLEISEDLMKLAHPSKKGRPLGSKNESDRNREKRTKMASTDTKRSEIEQSEHFVDGSINIHVRGQNIRLDLSIKTLDDIEPNLRIIDQILHLNLKKIKVEKKYHDFDEG